MVHEYPTSGRISSTRIVGLVRRIGHPHGLSREGLRGLIVALGLSLIAGCGSGSESGTPEELTNIDPGLAAIWDDMPAFQRGLLEDGELSFAEYERAANEYVGCMVELGYRADPAPKVDVSGRNLTWSIVSGGSPEELARYAVDDANCTDRYLGYIQYLWGIQAEPSADEREAAERIVEACMHEAGHTDMPRISDGEAFGSWLAGGIPPEFRVCIAEAERATGVAVGG